MDTGAVRSRPADFLPATVNKRLRIGGSARAFLLFLPKRGARASNRLIVNEWLTALVLSERGRKL
jgi:hypothetical protein